MQKKNHSYSSFYFLRPSTLLNYSLYHSSTVLFQKTYHAFSFISSTGASEELPSERRFSFKKNNSLCMFQLTLQAMNKKYVFDL